MGEQVIRVHRVRAAMELVGEVREIGSTTEAGRRRLVEGLLEVLGCVIGGVVHDTSYGLGLKRGIAGATLAGFDAALMEVFAAHHTQGSDCNPFHHAVMRRLESGKEQLFTSTNTELVARSEWDVSPWINDLVRPARVDHFLGSLRALGGNASVGCGFMRAAGDRPFTEEDREVLHLVHLGVGRMFPNPAPQARLTPRERETLDVLLEGATDKEIATRLNLSTHTARQYVKSIFKAFKVTSRAQLIARGSVNHP